MPRWGMGGSVTGRFGSGKKALLLRRLAGFWHGSWSGSPQPLGRLKLSLAYGKQASGFWVSILPCGPSWSLSASPLPRPGSPPPGDRQSGTKAPVRRPSTPSITLRATLSPSPSLRSSTINGCPGSGPPGNSPRRAAGLAVAVRAKFTAFRPSPCRDNRLKHLLTGQFLLHHCPPVVRRAQTES